MLCIGFFMILIATNVIDFIWFRLFIFVFMISFESLKNISAFHFIESDILSCFIDWYIRRHSKEMKLHLGVSHELIIKSRNFLYHTKDKMNWNEKMPYLNDDLISQSDVKLTFIKSKLMNNLIRRNIKHWSLLISIH